MVTFLALAGLPLLFALLGVPLALKSVPPNRFYGFRLSQAFESEAAWYSINAMTGYALIAAGGVAFVLSLAAFALFSDMRQQNLYLILVLLQSGVAILSLVVVAIRVG